MNSRTHLIATAALWLTACGGGGGPGLAAPEAAVPSPQPLAVGNTPTPAPSAAALTPQAQPRSVPSGSAPQATPSSGPAPSGLQPVYTVSAPTALAFDPAKGDLVEAGANGEVNRLEPDGSIVPVRETVAPDGSAPARSVAAAPDGSIFESSGQRPQQSGVIERIAPNGAVSLVLNRNAFGVAVDPAGSLWWAELGDTGPAQGIWHSALDGSAPVQAVAQPDTRDPDFREHSRGPHALVLGASGPVWSTGFSAYDKSGSYSCELDRLGLPPLGDCSRFSNSLGGVAAAPDGTLFVADAGNGQIDKVAPDGTITIIATGLNTGYVPPAPEALALDAFGTLWIADTAHNQVRSIAQ